MSIKKKKRSHLKPHNRIIYCYGHKAHIHHIYISQNVFNEQHKHMILKMKNYCDWTKNLLNLVLKVLNDIG